jgi:hypothetical protein
MTSKVFCVVSPGRSGSTALMDALRHHTDICIPPHNAELLSPHMREQFVRLVAARAGKRPETDAELLALFLASAGDARYVGFKVMPLQSGIFTDFARRTDVQFITLARRDSASLVASWLIAKRFNSFKVGSREVVRSIRFGADWSQEVRWHVRAIQRNLAAMGRLPGAIHLDYEDLCAPDFANARLNEFFVRSIRLVHPRAPTDAREYVENWDEFSHFVNEELRQQRASAPPRALGPAHSPAA